MAEYIDKEKLLQKLSRMIEYCKNDNKVNGLTALFQVGDAIMDCPTADVVQVVRCKDCKHATFYSCKNDACYKGIICEYRIAIGDENFFCACGEMRTQKERGAEK